MTLGEKLTVERIADVGRWRPIPTTIADPVPDAAIPKAITQERAGVEISVSVSVPVPKVAIAVSVAAAY
ncbi:MAG TPA: hypothetical protein VGM38_09370 [Pseudolysinimonas sp.]|jgi:hypothetical protein